MEGALPEGWVEARLGDLGEWRGGGTPTKSNPGYWTNGTIPWVSPKDMKVDEIHTPEDSITVEAVAKSATSLVPAGSLLVVVRSGILNRTLPVAVSGAEVAVNQDIKALIPHGAVLPKFLIAYFHARESAILHGAAKSGTTVASIDLERLKSQSIPLPPLNEQRRIVARLEELTERTGAARAALEAIPPLLDRFRQSVLAAAFRGDLTADWRAKNPDVEPASELLVRTCHVRNREQVWLKIEHACSGGSLPQLPRSWSWATVGIIAEEGIQTGPFGGLLHRSEFTRKGIPVIAVGNVKWGHLDMSSFDCVTEDKATQLSRFRVRAGDVLFTRTGTVGRSALVPPEQDGAVISSHILRVRHDPERYRSELLFRAFRGESTISAQLSELARGMTRPGFNTSLLSSLMIPVPPIEEQDIMLGVLSSLDDWVRSIHANILAGTARLTTLHQSLLSKAFRGELVPQDPTDEPASVLLERIRKEREAAGGGGRPKRGRKAK